MKGPGQGEGLPDAAETPLSVRIRTLTSGAHRGLESKTGWPETLGRADDVATMLRMFRALHISLEAARTGFEDVFREYGFWSHSESATAAIDADLAALGAGGGRGPATLLLCPDFDAALGLHYVASGSAMGNMLILRHIATHRDPSIAGADRFLKLSAKQAVPAFRTFRAALDVYGCREPKRGAAVIGGADAAFRACVAWLDANAAG